MRPAPREGTVTLPFQELRGVNADLHVGSAIRHVLSVSFSITVATLT